VRVIISPSPFHQLLRGGLAVVAAATTVDFFAFSPSLLFAGVVAVAAGMAVVVAIAVALVMAVVGAVVNVSSL